MLAQNMYIHHLAALFVIFTQVHHHNQSSEQEIQRVIRSLLEEYIQAQSDKRLPSWEIEPVSTKLPTLLQQFAKSYRISQIGVALHKYLLSLQTAGRLPATIKNYRSDIGQYLGFVSSNSPDQIVQKTEVAHFIEYEQTRGSSTSTIQRKLASMGQFFQWLQENGWLTTNQWKSFSTQEFTELLKDAKSVRELTTSVSQVDERPAVWSLPLKHIDVQQYLPKHFANSPIKKIKRVSFFSKVKQAMGAQPLLGYFNLAMGVLFLIGTVFLGYQQFFSGANSSQAFPANLTRPNRSLSFQGRLTSASRTPISSATPMRFRLYDSGPATGSGNLLWDSTSCSIDPDQDGIFSTTLGDACGTEITSDVFTEHSNVWLEVQVNSEILNPRQSIKTVAYALNSETLQGYPASASAVESTVLVMRSDGKVVFGNANPILEATGNSFAITAKTLTLETSSGSNGNVIINPDGTGQTLINSNALIEGYLSAPGATLSATYAGGTALTLKAGPSATGDIMQWQTSVGTPLGVIDKSGNIGIGTTVARAALEIAGTASSSGTLTFKGTTDPKIDILNGESFGIRTSVGGDAGLSERLTILNNGNVGIGTSNPSHKLQITGGNVEGLAVTSSNSPYVRLYTDDGAGWNWGLAADYGASSTFQLLRSAGPGGAPTTNVLLVNSAGNIGINTTSPSQFLDVAGDAEIANYLYFANGATNYLRFDGSDFLLSNDFLPSANNTYTLGANASRWSAIYGTAIYQGANQVCDTSGNCSAAASDWSIASGSIYPKNSTLDLLIGGISTASAKFGFINVNSGTPTATVAANFSLQVPTGANPAVKQNVLNGGSLGFRTSVGGDVGLTERLTILNGGNVGIGSTAPVGKLDVNDASNTAATLSLTNNTATTIGNAGNTLGVLDLQSTSLTTGNFMNMEVNALTTGTALNISRSGAGLTTGGELVNLDMGAAVAGNGLNVTTTGVYTGTGLLTLTGNSATTGTLAAISANGLSTGTGLSLTSSSTAFTSGGLLSITGSGAPAGSWTGDLAKIEYTGNNANVDGNALKVGITTAATSGALSTALNVTSAGPSETGAYVARFNDDGTYTDSTPFVIDTAGNVGIGTTNPTTLLKLYNPNELQLRMHRYLTGVTPGDVLASIEFEHNDNNDAGVAAKFRAVVDGAAGETGFSFETGRPATISEKVRITSAGNLGIGSTAPTALLDIAGNASSSGTLSFRGTTDPKINILNGESFGIRTSVGGDAGLTERLTILNNGNVGIGSATPAQTLDVVGNVRISGLTASLPVKTNASKDLITGAIDLASAEVTGILTMNKGGTNRALTASAGSVAFSDSDSLELTAVGTTGYLLTSAGAGTPTWTDPATLVAANNYWDLALGALYPKNSTADLLIGSSATASAKFGFINVNSGTPTATIAGNFSIRVPTGANPAVKQNVLNGGSLGFQTSVGGDASLTERLTILNNGNVGIGSVTPGTALDVVGTGRFSTGIDANGTSSTITNLILDGNTGTALNISGTSFTTDINLQNGETIDNDTDNTVNVGYGAANGIFKLTSATEAFLTSSVALNIDSNTTNTLKFGTGANAKTITLGNITGTTAVNVNTGTAGTTYTTTNGIFTLNTGTGNISLGTDAVAKTITLGNATGATGVAINSGTNDITLTSTDQIKLNSSKAAGGTTTEAFSVKTTTDLAAADEVLQIGDSAADFLTILGNGNVGIGSVSPGYKLDVNGSTRTTALYDYDNTAYYVDPNGAAISAILNANVGIGTTSPLTKLHINPKVIDDATFSYDSNSLMVVHQTPTSTATLNDPKTVLMLARQGTSGQAYGAAAEFDLSRYENNGVNSRTRLDISLAHGSFDPSSNRVMTLLSSGNVGIGSVAPAQKLDIVGNLQFSGALMPNGQAGTSTYLLTSAGAGSPPTWTDPATLSAAANFWTINAGAIYPKNTTVDFLLGATSTASAKLSVININSGTPTMEIQGDFKFGGIGSNKVGTLTSNTTQVTMRAPAGAAMGIGANGGNSDIYISATNNVGIGTSSPTALLDIAGNASSSATLSFRGTTDPKINVLNGENFGIQTSVGGDTGLTERLTILNTGNVGIGSASPSQKLEVGGEIELANYLYFANASSEYLRWDGSNFIISDDFLPNADNTLDLGATGSRWKDVYVGPGSVHIGSTSTDEGVISYDTSGNILNIGTDATTNGDIAFFTDDLYLDKSSGNVGIGTTVPPAHLAVSGGNILQTAAGNPTTLDTYSIGIDANRGIYVTGRYAYVLNTTGGDFCCTNNLEVLDISDPTNLTQVGSVSIGSGSGGQTIVVQGTTAYIAETGGGLVIVDVRDPTNPTVLGSYNTSGEASSVAVTGKTAFVADGSAGLLAVNVNNPSSPSLLDTYDTTDARDVVVVGKYAYVADDTDGLLILDISDPTNIVSAGTYNTDIAPIAVYVTSSIAYVVDQTDAELEVLDVKDPADVGILDTYVTGGNPQDVHVAGDYAYLADSTDGLVVLNVSDPNNVSLVGESSGGAPQSIYVSGKFAFLVDSQLRLFDINGSKLPTLSAGAISGHSLEIAEQASFENAVSIGKSLSVGSAGIFTSGTLSALGTSANYLVGNLGIGTTSPGQKLDVAGEIELANYLYFGNGTTEYLRWDGSDYLLSDDFLPNANDSLNLGSDTARWADLFLGGETLHLGASTTDEGTISYSSSNVLSFNTDSTTNGDISFFTDDLYLDKSSGYVGINSTTPGYQLDVNGSTRTSAVYDYDNTAYYVDPNGAATSAVLNANVGIGTTGPTSLLHTLATGSKSADYTANLLNNTSTSSTASITKTGLSVLSTGVWNGSGAINRALHVSATGGTANYAAIFEAGLVGIGTTTPGERLEVRDGRVVLNNSDNNSALLDDNTATLDLVNRSGTAGAGPKINFQGWGYGTYSNQIGAAIAAPLISASVNGASQDLVFLTRNAAADAELSERVRILSTGNVGIGTTSPTAPLAVSSAAETALVSATAGVGKAGVYGTSGTVAGYGVVGFNNSTTGVGVLAQQNSTGYALYSTGGKNYFSGNVGIGSTGPTALLDVAGAGVINSLTLDANSGTALNISGTSFTTDLNLQNGETIDNETDGRITLTGNSLITGTSYFGSGATYYVDNTGVGNLLGLTLTNSGNPFVISGAATNAIIINNTGTTIDLSMQNGETIDNNTNNTINLGFGAANGILNLTSATEAFLTSSVALNIDSATTNTLKFGTGANAKTITLGNATGATALNLNSGTGDITLTSTDLLYFKATNGVSHFNYASADNRAQFWNSGGTASLIVGFNGSPRIETSTSNFHINYDADSHVYFFGGAASGDNRNLYVYGYDTGATAQKYGFFNVDTTGDFNIESTSGEDINLRTNSGDTLTVDSGGNVGIGSTGPTQKLDVNGRISMATWTADGDTVVYRDTTTNSIALVTSDRRLKKNIVPLTGSLPAFAPEVHHFVC